MHHSVNIIKSELNDTKANLEHALKKVGVLDDTLSRVAKVDFHAEAYFKAEETTYWLVEVVLRIVGENGSSLNIRCERKIVWQQPRYPYNEWKKQRESDLPRAKEVLEELASKWGCSIRSIGV